MKKLLLLISLLNFYLTGYSQPGLEHVSFDNPTDQSDYFYGNQSMHQVANGGITGGSLMTPDSNNWGNDNSRYCTRFRAMSGYSYIVSMWCFYDGTQGNPLSFDRTMSIWLQPSSDPNHYIISTLEHNNKAALLTYYSADYSNTFLPTDLNWYKMSVEIFIDGDSVHFINNIYDGGPNGTNLNLITSASNVITDTVFARDSMIEVSITGSKAGGGIYIDDFEIEGYRGYSSCINTFVSDATKEEVNVFISPASRSVMISGRTNHSAYEIFDIRGGMILRGNLPSDNMIRLNDLPAGTYFLKVAGLNKSFRIPVIN